MDITAELCNMGDSEYRKFHSALIPNVNPSAVIGVRVPQLRAFAKRIVKSEEAKIFLHELPHKYYDEDNLHAFLIEQIKDYSECICELDRFLPFVDNWATCDMCSPKILGKNPERLIEDIRRWLKSGDTYTVRFAVNMLMKHFLDENFKEEYLQLAILDSDEYYLQMVSAWYFATALSKQYNSAVKVIEDYRLDKFTHNKAIQKAVESRRLSEEHKSYLKQFKLK